MKKRKQASPAPALRRQTNWPARLNALIDQRRAAVFEWGKHDCCLFACDWLDLCVGVDPARDSAVFSPSLRGSYTNVLEAARVLKRWGGVEGIATRASKHFGWPQVSAKLARRGDIVAVPTQHGPALGICLGTEAALPGAAGLSFVPITSCQCAWQIA